MEYAIETESLTKTFGNGFTALDGVSLKIPKGDVVGYLGPNGAGKTTTIKILTALIKPTSGRACVGGVDVSEGPKEALQKVGALIEIPGMYEYLTPREMLTYFGKIYRLDNTVIDRRIKEVLELVKLSDWENKRIGSFSTGMQRRLVIAKAVFHRPEILILDEPVLGLDPKGIKDVRELIKRFQSEGMTIFLSSHLLGEVAEVCDSVIFLDRGRVITSESIENIGNKMGSKTINVQFLRPLAIEETNKLRSMQLVDVVEVKDGFAQLQFDGKPDTSYQILRELLSEGFEIVSYSPEEMGLEEYYVSVMNDEMGVG